MRTIAMNTRMFWHHDANRLCDMAARLAEEGRRVLFIDCDLHKPSLHMRYKLNNQVGLTNILEGIAQLADAAFVMSQPMLCVITAGPTLPYAIELKESDHMKKMLIQAGQKFDFVLMLDSYHSMDYYVVHNNEV